MRVIGPLLVGVCIVATFACGRSQSRDRNRINLSQNVTSDRKPTDKIFIDFEKNWRQFISTSPALALPVVARERKPGEQPWEPLVVSECVFSPDAGGMVPQVTLTWSEPVSSAPEIALAAQQQPPAETPRLRFDLSVHYNGFGRNYYSTALAGDKLQRFALPQNSGLVNDQEAVLLTGPGLFPMLVDFNIVAVQDRDTAQRFGRHTLVLRDLNPGLSYTIRLDRPAGNGWNEDRRSVFLTPVCPS